MLPSTTSSIRLGHRSKPSHHTRPASLPLTCNSSKTRLLDTAQTPFLRRGWSSISYCTLLTRHCSCTRPHPSSMKAPLTTASLTCNCPVLYHTHRRQQMQQEHHQSHQQSLARHRSCTCPQYLTRKSITDYCIITPRPFGAQPHTPPPASVAAAQPITPAGARTPAACPSPGCLSTNVMNILLERTSSHADIPMARTKQAV